MAELYSSSNQLTFPPSIAENNEGQTPQHIAEDKNYDECVELVGGLRGACT